jgi:hypothetical protein
VAKLTKPEVGYEHPAKGEDDCGGCAHFRSPSACEIVTGTIRPEDWCRRFVAMPSESKAQQQAMAIAEHSPSKLYKRNKSMLSMTKEQLHDFASTKTKGLPAKKKKFSI